MNWINLVIADTGRFLTMNIHEVVTPFFVTAQCGKEAIP
jgi:hypothetical protein